MTTPKCSRRSVPALSGSSPSSRTRPESARARPSSSRIVVLLPAPFSPMKPIMQPEGSLKLTLSSVKPL